MEDRPCFRIPSNLGTGYVIVEEPLDKLLCHEESHGGIEAKQWVDDKQESLLLMRLCREDRKPQIKRRELESKQKQRVLQWTRAGGWVGQDIRD